MNIDNFDLIQNILEFRNEDDFYFLQIIKRKKEHPELGSNNYVLRTYCIRSVEHLENKKDEIIDLCTTHNARAYINPNRRSFENIALHTLKKVTDIILNKDYKSARKAYESVCGKYHNEPNKKWIIDMDGCSIMDDVVFLVIEDIQINNGNLIASIPTKNGIHLITSPFRLDKFKYNKMYDVHKNNPTILFCLQN